MRRVALFLPSLAGGGAERVFVHLANAFAGRGITTDLLLAAATGPYLSEVRSGVGVRELGGKGVSRSIPGLARHIRTSKPDVVLSALDHANVAAIVARALSGTRSRCIVCVRSVPSVWRLRTRSARGRLLFRAMRWSYPRADRLVANSSAVRDDVVASLGMPADRIAVVPNPVNIEEIDTLAREPLNDDWLNDDSAPVILGVGRLESLKDFPTLLEAFAKVRARRECRLLILGEGPDRERLEARRGELRLDDDCRMPGFVANPFPWIRRASLLVSSSISEGCPNIVLQALACGTPIVATDSVGGVSEVLEKGRWGDLVPVGDAGAMAAAIEASLLRTDHPDGRIRAADFSEEKIVDRFLEVMEQSCRSRSDAGVRS